MPGKLLKRNLMRRSTVKRIQGKIKSTNFTEKGRNKIGMDRRWGKKKEKLKKKFGFNLSSMQHGDIGTPVCCTIGSKRNNRGNSSVLLLLL